MNGKTKMIATMLALGMVATGFTLIAPPVRAAPGIAVVVYDATDGIGTCYEDGGSAGTGLYANNTAWVISHDLTNQFNVAQCPEELADSGQDYSASGGYDWFVFDAGNHWALGDGWLAGETAVSLTRLEFGQTYTHNGAPTTALANYSAATTEVLDTNDPQWFTQYPTLEPIPAPTWAAGTLSWNDWTDAITQAVCVGWNWYYSDTGITRASYVLGGTTGPGPQSVAVSGHSYYVIEPLWDNTGGTPASYGNYLFSAYAQETGGGSTFPPEATALTAWNPAGLAGDTTSEWVMLNATITDPDGTDTVTAAEVRVDGGTPIAMTAVDGAFDSISEAVTATYNFPNGFTEGAHTFEVHGQDNSDGWNTTWVSSSFTVTDTTAPLVGWNSVPASTVYDTAAVNFQASYEDFTAYDPNVAVSYFEYRVNNGSWNQFAWNNGSFAWGSYTNILTYTIPAGTFAAGDWVDYQGQVTDTAATPLPGVLSMGSFQVLAAPPGVQDPYPIYGYVYLYDGTSGGGYNPITSTGAAVSVTWINSTTGAPSTISTTTNALGQYSVDILNYTDLDTVEITATFEAPYNNNGYNYTQIDVVGFPGGREQEVVCGVPYMVNITTPLPGANELASVSFPATYEIRDRDGALAQGYFTFTDGPMEWYSGDPLFVPPALTTFDGTASATPGTFTDTLTLYTGPTQWINITEGGPLELNNFPTPWGAFSQSIGFAMVDGWLDDYDNITVNVSVGGFDWNVVNGWNMVSVPQDPTNKGGNGIFDSFDALNECFWQLGGTNQISLADRTGGNPSTYNVFDYGMAEGASFPMDGTHGYWIWASGLAVSPTSVHFNATNYTTSVWDGTNWVMSVNAAAGWNLLGFTHNYTTWATVPTASMFTDGTVDADLLTGGLAGNKIVATQWNYNGVQWYNSYVDTTTFPGMATHNWAWDTSYSGQPGNGYFLWVEAGVTIDFNVNF